MQETNQEDEKTEKSVTWNGSALVAELTAACDGGRALFQAAMLLLQFCFLLPAAFCYLCPSPSFVLFFPVYGLAMAIPSASKRNDGGGVAVANKSGR
jgi:hypothetical protein